MGSGSKNEKKKKKKKEKTSLECFILLKYVFLIFFLSQRYIV